MGSRVVVMEPDAQLTPKARHDIPRSIVVPSLRTCDQDGRHLERVGMVAAMLLYWQIPTTGRGVQ